MTLMPDRVFKPEIEKDDALERADSYLPVPSALESADDYPPVPTEISPVAPESRIVVYTDPRSAGADRFRLVQIRLRSLQASKNLKTLLITSPLPGDGKSTVALNLATALSEKGKHSVLLLEADVHRPALITRLGLKPWPGLTECHRRGSDPMLAIRRIDPLGFYLLPAGRPVEEGSSLLQSNFVSQLLKGLCSSFFSWILIDSPPTTPIADILGLKAHVDATLLVAHAGRTPREAIEETTRNLGRDHIIGIILNGVEGLDRVYSKYYGYGRSNTPLKPSKPKGIEGLGLRNYAK